MIKNIIFDWSGVINDNTFAVYQTAMEVFKTFGAQKISFKEFGREWASPYMKFYNKYLPNLTLEDQKTAYQKAIVRFEQHQFYPGINNSLKNFYKQSINMFVVSNDPPKILFGQIKKWELDGFFKEIFCDVYNKLETVQKIITNFNLVSDKTIIIGDTSQEIEAGKKVRIKTGAVTWGICSEKKLKSLNPDYIIHNLAELNKIILN